MKNPKLVENGNTASVSASKYTVIIRVVYVMGRTISFF